MLTLSELKKYYSENIYQNHLKGVLVEYVQYELLDSIFKFEQSSKISFMGGTAIRIVYGSSRFSEDLDFDNFGLSFAEFEDLLKLVIKDMRLKGFEIEFRFVEKGAFHCYIKFPKILIQNGLTSHENEKILVRIDTVKKEKLFDPIPFFINKFDIYKKILVNPSNIVLSQKLIAATNRKVAKGRDFYDISYLYGFTVPDFEYIEKYLGKNQESFIGDLLKQCDKLDFNSLARDVEPFLVDSSSTGRVIKFKDFIFTKLKNNK
ncbi:MAG: nucleotidyl transferase AbiEii/AbiGii toxin family protein [Candidatus Paceibacterota bacterium]|jgi:predicted nucleotidyltransferase component of viral defense system